MGTSHTTGAETRTARRTFWRGALEAIYVPLLFTLVGLGCYAVERAAVDRAAVELAAVGRAAAYPARVTGPIDTSDTSDTSETWLVDGFNVVQVALLGGRDRHAWWTSGQRAELLARAEAFEEAEAPIFVVFDGARAAGADPAGGRVRPVFAASADEWLVDRVKRADAPERLVVVTADRGLAGRVRHHGARVVSPGEFLGRCRTGQGRGVITTE
jgi:hypothetical protein